MFEEALHGTPRYDSPRKRAQIKQCALLAGKPMGCPCVRETTDDLIGRPFGMMCLIPEAMATYREMLKDTGPAAT